MKLLMFGDDSAAHVFAWKLLESSMVDELILAPGNGGTSFFASSVDLGFDAVAVSNFVVAEGLDLVVADDRAIAAGMTDEIAALPLPIVGSRRTLHRLVRSRCAARDWLQQHALPVPRGRACSSLAQAETFAAGLSFPVRISADALAGPVEVCADRSALAPAIASCFGGGTEGVVVEELVSGPLVTASMLTDGTESIAVPTTRLWRHGDRLTAGFDGAHSGAGPLWSRLEAHLDTQIRQPLHAALHADGPDARGWLGAICVLGPRGPLIQSLQLVPHGLELAATLPRLEGDLLPLLLGCARGSLASVDAPRWRATTVLGAGLFDAAHSAGPLDVGSFDAFDPGVLVFHHHTASSPSNQYVPVAARGPSRRLSFGNAASWPTMLGRGFAAGHAPQLGTSTLEHDALRALVVAIGDDRIETKQRLYNNLRRLPQHTFSYREDIGARDL